MSKTTKPIVVNDTVYGSNIKVDSWEWLNFLRCHNSFYYTTLGITFGLRKNNQKYWQAYKKCKGILKQRYLGISPQVTKQELEITANEFKNLNPTKNTLVKKVAKTAVYNTDVAKLTFQKEEIGAITILTINDCQFVEIEDLLSLGIEIK